MIIGIPKEIKIGEKRVAMTPQGVDALVSHHHKVMVEMGAGEGSGFNDREYEKAGAILTENVKRIWKEADLIVKVKEPQEQEFPLLRPGQILFTYLHLAASKPLTKALLDSRIVGI
ncbi:MAG: alanine dehydrogenase, partial [Deltaproteobacteria bacterium]|nr:alanine dehydrogenase [Deltaproteobacteria bacterium]